MRARDNAGQLSAGTIQHYTVTGKQDNDGPVATLKYVGTQVGKFLGDAEYRAEVERNGEAYSILDSEFGGGTSFGFVIEWYDLNGVYATNHMRGWVDAYDKDASGNNLSSWPEGAREGGGDYTWNILSTNSDGTMFGRVSPNWDLLMVNTNQPNNATKYYDHTTDGVIYGKTIVVTNGAGTTLELRWMWTNEVAPFMIKEKKSHLMEWEQ